MMQSWLTFHSLVTVVMLMGLSATTVRYLLKVLHRLVVDSPRIYSVSMWIQVCGLVYIDYIFLSYWSFGLLSHSMWLKIALFFANFSLIFVSKLTMI